MRLNQERMRLLENLPSLYFPHPLLFDFCPGKNNERAEGQARRVFILAERGVGVVKNKIELFTNFCLLIRNPPLALTGVLPPIFYIDKDRKKWVAKMRRDGKILKSHML